VAFDRRVDRPAVPSQRAPETDTAPAEDWKP
jgi:hypothetical protein